MSSLASWTLAFVSMAFLYTPAAAFSQQEDEDTFFSGTVDEFTDETVTVTREVLGNPPEHRTFTITALTKVEGKLGEGVRVTVKFRATEDTFLAEAITVRDPLKPKKKS